MLADLVSAADGEVAAFAGEGFVERVSAESDAGAELVAIADGGPAFDKALGFEEAVRADGHVLVDTNKFADFRAWSDDGIGVHAGRWGDVG